MRRLTRKKKERRLLPPNLFTARAIFYRRVAEALAPPLFFFYLATGEGALPQRARGEGEGAGMGGRWAERPPARSPAAAVVVGGDGALGFRVAGDWGMLHGCRT